MEWEKRTKTNKQLSEDPFSTRVSSRVMLGRRKEERKSTSRNSANLPGTAVSSCSCAPAGFWLASTLRTPGCYRTHWTLCWPQLKGSIKPKSTSATSILGTVSRRVSAALRSDPSSIGLCSPFLPCPLGILRDDTVQLLPSLPKGRDQRVLSPHGHTVFHTGRSPPHRWPRCSRVNIPPRSAVCSRGFVRSRWLGSGSSSPTLL
mmetsp:Transcript_56824/g.123541  ORF Transcript_56824/g.123541 Transcript_56824/m.123541 type:complete len:204 (+) Transcript_56824:561-1172(+)